MDNSFLPDGYEPPASDSNYMKFQQGDNTFRVLGSAIIGWEYWNKEGKPVRLRTQPEGTPDDIRKEAGRTDKVKHFWAFPVYNYTTKKVEVLEITQKTVMTAITALVKNPKWGPPMGYDITVNKQGEGLETEYAVMPEPHTDSPVQNMPPVNMDALFEGGNPLDVKM